MTQCDLVVTRYFHKTNNGIFVLKNVIVCINIRINHAAEPNFYDFIFTFL